MFTTLFCTFRIAGFREMQHRYPKLTRGDRFCGNCLGILGIVIQGSKREIKYIKTFLLVCSRVFVAYLAVSGPFQRVLFWRCSSYVCLCRQNNDRTKTGWNCPETAKYAKSKREKQVDKVRSLSVCINNDC